MAGLVTHNQNAGGLGNDVFPNTGDQVLQALCCQTARGVGKDHHAGKVGSLLRNDPIDQ